MAAKSGSPGLFSGPALPALAARFGARLAALTGKPFRFRSTVVAARHAHVTEMLSRDLDFRIAPINAARMEAVNGPFLLGMDRGDVLATERAAVYRALAAVDLAPFREAAGQLAEAALDVAPRGSLDVVGGYARPIAAHTASRLFGLAEVDPAEFAGVVRTIFHYTFLDFRGDAGVEREAIIAGGRMRDWFAAEIARRADLLKAGKPLEPDLMGRLMDPRASGAALAPDTIRRLLGGMLVGSVDTTASSVAKIIWVIGRDRRLAMAVARDAGRPDRLRGWCWEALRRWPHNPVLLRRAAAATTLGGRRVEKGDRVVAWTQAAMLDGSVFERPGEPRPDRPPGIYLHFGGGLHPCAGRAVNDFQIPLLVGALVRRELTRAGDMRWDGPFPDHLEVRPRR